MTIPKTSLFVLGGALLSAAAGCSGGSSDPYGPSPDFASLQAQFKSPSGTFAAGNESSAIASYNGKQVSNDFGVGGTPVGGSTSVKSKSIALLDTQSGTSTLSWCSGLAHGDGSGSCACPDGGSIYYDLSGIAAAKSSGGPIDVTARIAFSACRANAASIDGHEFLHMSATGPITATSDGGLEMLLDAHFTVASAQLSASIDFDMEYANKKWWVAIKVNDGSIAIGSDGSWNGATKTGKLFVRDKSAQWTCDLQDGKGTCTSDKGETRTIQ